MPWCFSASSDDNADSKIALVETVRIPVVLNGKEVGSTSLPAGTKVQVLSREGNRVSIKCGSMAPAWIEASKLADEKPSASPPQESAAQKAPDPEATLKQMPPLIEGKKWGEVAKACRSFAGAEQYSKLATLGDRLTSSLESLAASRRQRDSSKTEIERLRRNADVTGRPNPLHPEDNSPMERAAALREKADKMEQEITNAIKEAETSIEETGNEIADALSELQRIGDASLKDRDRTGVYLGPNSPEESMPLWYKNYKIAPRGPKVHGLQVGMPLDAAIEAIRVYFPALSVSYDDGFPNMDLRDLVKASETCSVRPVRVRDSSSKNTLCDITTLGVPPKVVVIIMESPLLSALFNTPPSMSSQDFTQAFIDGYSIPEVKTKTRTDNLGRKTFSAHYTDPTGWELQINDDTLILGAVPKKSEMGFGQ